MSVCLNRIGGINTTMTTHANVTEFLAVTFALRQLTFLARPDAHTMNLKPQKFRRAGAVRR